jgi:hypothetical protein
VGPIFTGQRAGMPPYIGVEWLWAESAVGSRGVAKVVRRATGPASRCVCVCVRACVCVCAMSQSNKMSLLDCHTAHTLLPRPFLNILTILFNLTLNF